MAKQKYIVVSSCWIDRKSVPKGTIIELDMEDPIEATKIATLNRAGRIGEANKKNIDAIAAEIKSEQAQEDRLSRLAGARQPALA